MKAIVVGSYSKHLTGGASAGWQVFESLFARRGYTFVHWHYGPKVGDYRLPFLTTDSFAGDAGPEDVIDASRLAGWKQCMAASWQCYRDPDAEATLFVRQSRQLFEAIQPAAFFGWNTLESRFGLAGDVARSLGIPVYSFERGFLPDSFRWDRFNAALPTERRLPSMEEDERRGSDLLGRIALSETRHHPVRPDDGTHSGIERWLRPHGRKKKILVVGVCESDLAATPDGPEKRLMLPGFRDSLDIAATLAASGRYAVLYKPHPLQRRAAWHSAPRGVYVAEGDPLRLIEAADCVVAPSTKLEGCVLLLDKPLVTIGRGFLSVETLSKPCWRRDEVVNAVDSAIGEHRPGQSKPALAAVLGSLHRSEWLLLAGRYPEAHNTAAVVARLAEEIEVAGAAGEPLALPGGLGAVIAAYASDRLEQMDSRERARNQTWPSRIVTRVRRLRRRW